MPCAGLEELAAAEPLGEDGPLVLGDGPLDLQEELVLGIVGDGAVEEDDLAAGLAELLQEQDLVGVLAGEPVGAEDGDDVEVPAERRVAQAVQAGPVETGAGVALIGVDVILREFMRVRRRPACGGRRSGCRSSADGSCRSVETLA